VKRGEIWTVAGARDYAGKPRPSLIIQDEAFDATDSLTICGFTSDLTAASLIRFAVQPTAENGLFVPCEVMVDKITTVPRSKLGRKIGDLHPDDITKLNRAIMIFLGVANLPSAAIER
jgi:mRNA interferase MazF